MVSGGLVIVAIQAQAFWLTFDNNILYKYRNYLASRVSVKDSSMSEVRKSNGIRLFLPRVYSRFMSLISFIILVHTVLSDGAK